MGAAVMGVVLAGSLVAASMHYAWAQWPYEGQTIRIVVGVSPGGGHDILARLVARHISRYIPGQPSLLVTNMPGAGGLIAANHVYYRANPELTIGAYSGHIIVRHLLGYEEAKIDGRSLGWLGAFFPIAQTCALTNASGI